ncbi:MAG TPA: type II toxin-antitoxin system death-on-curing family toxin [Rhizomicrobium sp.]|jgi:death-on-curing protein|nr:type II toxin-antitoxin system death-on-curing family toxin [Rhizomicrobium sp.]
MSGWVWLDSDALLTAHDEQLAEHGGATGIRDQGLFESALARPKNLAAYGTPDAAALAAAYTYGLAKNHAFVDGNKRIALVALESFLALNRFDLTADDSQTVMVILSVASGAFNEDDLAMWIRKNQRIR